MPKITVLITNLCRIYEVLGARSIGKPLSASEDFGADNHPTSAFKAGFDHFWRNARTHTLHDPVSHKRAEVGRYVLTGELPTVRKAARIICKTE